MFSTEINYQNLFLDKHLNKIIWFSLTAGRNKYENSLYRNFLIIGIITLFFGVSIVPAISGDIGEIKNDLSSPIEKGSTVWDYICGFIYNLHI